MGIDIMAGWEDYINPDDAVLLLQTKNDRSKMEHDYEKYYVLHSGRAPDAGDKIVLHTDGNGNTVTHGASKIQTGDPVLVTQSREGQNIALRPAKNADRYCPSVSHNIVIKSYPSNPGWEPSLRWFYAYDVHLAETFYRIDQDMNINMYFGVRNNEDRWGGYWPYGGVSIGFGYNDGTGTDTNTHGPSSAAEWWWCTNQSPYMTLAQVARWDCNPDVDGSHWCFMDALTDNVCNGGRCENPIPPYQPVNMIHIQIRSTGPMWDSFDINTRTSLVGLDVCRAVPEECQTRCYGLLNGVDDIDELI